MSHRRLTHAYTVVERTQITLSGIARALGLSVHWYSAARVFTEIAIVSNRPFEMGITIAKLQIDRLHLSTLAKKRRMALMLLDAGGVSTPILPLWIVCQICLFRPEFALTDHGRSTGNPDDVIMQLDHIKPLKYLALKGDAGLPVLANFCNLQVLAASENSRKLAQDYSYSMAAGICRGVVFGCVLFYLYRYTRLLNNALSGAQFLARTRQV